MAGFTPNEGETLVANMVYKRVLTDRDANLVIGLFTNSSPGETITEATLTEPTGTGYSRQTLSDGSWTVSGDTATYPTVTFTAGSGGWSGSVQGYFIATQSSGGTQRILHIEVDASGPYTFTENDTYDIDLSNTVA